MSKCRSCGAELKWIKTVSGGMMPCNAEPVTYWKNENGKDTIVTASGEIVKADLENSQATYMNDTQKSELGYVSHWATCPTADKHRRKA